MAKTAMKTGDVQPKRINVALQGGGSHGAFTWGVLDRILEDGRVTIDGICGTSAGAMNAVVYAYGKMKGGPENARQALHDFWQDISRVSDKVGLAALNPFAQLTGYDMQDLIFKVADSASRIWSPYQLNPWNFNPLRDVLERHVILMNSTTAIARTFSSAQRTSEPENRVIFTNAEISADSVPASACLPLLFKAVEIDGEYYWDGGYIGNPALYPMIYDTKTADFLIVHINPIARTDVPETAPEIMNRINEVSFNSALVREMRAIAFVQKMLKEDWLKDEHRANATGKVDVSDAWIPCRNPGAAPFVHSEEVVLT